MAEKGKIEEKTWMPSLKWLTGSFFIIVVFVIGFYFTLNYLLKPYMRDIPMEVTPWLDKTDETQSIQE